jgi:hypothetical protein
MYLVQHDEIECGSHYLGQKGRRRAVPNDGCDIKSLDSTERISLTWSPLRQNTRES